MTKFARLTIVVVLFSCLFISFNVSKGILLTQENDTQVFRGEENELINFYNYDHNLPLNVEIRTEYEDNYYARYHILYDSTNGERIPAHLYLPKIYNPVFSPEQKREKKFEEVRKKNSLATAPPWPVVFFMHFHVSDKGLASLVASGNKGYAARGLAVFAIDGIYRGERKVEGKDILEGTPYEISANMQQQVFDILRGLDYLKSRPDIDKNRIGFMGISMGAFSGVIVAAVDKSVKAVSLIDGGGDLETFIKKSEYESVKNILKYIEENPDKISSIREIFKFVDPLFYAPFIAPRPVIMMNGKKDTTVPTVCAQSVYDALKEPKEIIWFDSGHEDIPISSVIFKSFRFFQKNL